MRLFLIVIFSLLLFFSCSKKPQAVAPPSTKTEALEVYQEALEEGRQVSKIESIPRMIKLGLSLEIIATSLDLPLEIVQAEANKNQN